jgi:alpha-mannosidase
MKGTYALEYSFIPYLKTARAQAYAEGYGFAYPSVSAISAECHGGDFAPELDLVAFDSEYIRMTAFKKAEDRESIIIRFFNSHTEELPLTLTLAPIFKSARLVDLGERVLRDLGAVNGGLSLNVGAKKIVTLELTY